MNSPNTMNPQEEANILDQKQEAMRALHASQEAIRESMVDNTAQGKSNG